MQSVKYDNYSESSDDEVVKELNLQLTKEKKKNLSLTNKINELYDEMEKMMIEQDKDYEEVK